MNRFFLAVALALSLVAAPLTAQDLFDNLGQMRFSAGFGTKQVESGTVKTSTTPVFAGLEVGLVTLPKNVILGLRANVSSSVYDVKNFGGTTTVTAVGPSAMIGAHWGLKNLGTGNAILDKMDLFGGIGVSLSLSSWVRGGSSGTNDPVVDVGYSLGIAYYPNLPMAPFLKNLGVTLETSSFASLGLGLVYKL